MSCKLLLSQDFNSVEQTPEPLIESNYFNFNREKLEDNPLAQRRNLEGGMLD